MLSWAKFHTPRLNYGIYLYNCICSILLVFEINLNNSITLQVFE